LKNLHYIALILVISGCNPEGVGCFKSTGPVETRLIDLPTFTAIDISNNIDVHISPDQTNEVLITAGSNILPGVRAEVIDSVLYLENLNSCNFTRKYVNPVIEISNPELELITQHGYGEVVSTDTLRFDKLRLVSEECSGDFRLSVNVSSLSVGSNNISNFYISGFADQLSVGIYWSDGIFFGENLSTNTCYVTHSGSNSIHLNVSGSLRGSINNLGNVILHQQMPKEVNVVENGNGMLIFDP
jgi:hypothetical protein